MPARFADFGQMWNAWAASAHPTSRRVFCGNKIPSVYAQELIRAMPFPVGWAFMPTRFRLPSGEKETPIPVR
nr:hypothetical protein [uncultured Kingella sp.]